MANLSKIMKKLQAALLQRGCKVKLNTRQFYSEDQNRMITVYSVVVPVWSEKKRKMVDKEILSTCSTADVVKQMVDLLEVFRSEA